MMSLTHAAIATTTTAIVLGTANPWMLVVSAIASQIPDLDTTESFAGRIIYPLARYFESNYPHRTITHSFISTFVVGLLFIPVWYLWGWQWWAAIVMGQFMGWFADTFTKQGVCAFFPSPARLVIPGNPKARLESRSPGEWFVLCLSVILLIATVNIISTGGLTQTLTTAMFQTVDSAVSVFERNSEKLITIEVDGVHLPSGRTLKNQVYTVLEIAGKDLICESQDRKIYRIGEAIEAQIRPQRVKVVIGDKLTITPNDMTIQDISVWDWAQRLQPNSYLTGYLQLDDMNDVSLAIDPNTYPTLYNQGGNILLKNASAQDVILQIGSQWIIQGRVIAKVRT
jgi:inner membrane protein